MAVSNVYPLFLQQEIIDAIRRKRYIIIIDILNFFFQLFIYPNYCNQFILISYKKIKQSKIIFIGYTNFSLYTQCFIDKTLKLYRGYYRTFINDIIIFSDIFKDYYKHLKIIFSLFKEKNININLKKLYIGYSSVEFLSFYIDTLDIHFTEDYI